MRKGNLVTGAVTVAVTAVLTVTATILTETEVFAGDWKDDQHGTWYEQEDGSYPRDGWAELDGKWYYFTADGYLLRNTITPDGYQVDANGTCAFRQSVSQITFTPDSVTTDLAVNDYLYENPTSYYYHILEITNNSPYTIALTVQDTALASSGEPAKALTRLSIGKNTGTDFRVGVIEDGAVGSVTGSAAARDLPPGCTVFVKVLMTQAKEVSTFKTQIQTQMEMEYQPAAQDITLSVAKQSGHTSLQLGRSNLQSGRTRLQSGHSTIQGGSVTLKARNHGTSPADHALASVLFLKDGKPVDYAETYLMDRDQQLKPDTACTRQVATNQEFDDVWVHVGAVRK